ncbi:MAG: cupin domain-containing protein [Rhodomicrobium sp.]
MHDVTLIRSGQVAWSPHPTFAGVLVAWLVQRPEAPAVSCALVQLPPQAEVPEHAHGQEDDILYVLHGRARMWIEERGDMQLEAGTFLRIPRGVRHRPHSFEDGFLAFNVWASNPVSQAPIQPEQGEYHD